MAFTGNFTCNTFKEGLYTGTAVFTSGVFKIALYTNEATLNQNTAAYTTDGEVVGSGYTAGGEIITPTIGPVGDVAYVSFSNATWAASITARGALVYKVSGPALFVLDFGSDKTSVSQFQVQFPPASAKSAIIRIS